MSNKRNEITNFESSSLKIQPVFSELKEVEVRNNQIHKFILFY